jgi:PAS domain S-box-containing protein
MLSLEGSLRSEGNAPAQGELILPIPSTPGLFEVDMKGNFTKVPQMLEEITGFTKEELDLLSIQSVTFTEDREKVMGSIEAIKNGAPIMVSEVELFSETNGSHPVELILLPVVASGEISGMWGTIKDISRRKNLEKELRMTREVQEASQRFMTDFVSLLTREIRQPLTTILLTLEMLDSGSFGELNDVQAERIAQLIDVIDRLKTTLNEALDMSRNIDEDIQLDRRTVSLENLIVPILEAKSGEAEAREVKIISTYPENRVKAEVDKKAITEVITNLLDRAIKDSPKEGQVILEMEEKETNVVISISDSGKGIPEMELKQLFDKLHMDPERESKSLSEGMNLYITKRIVERHGGRIWCESFVGLGTTYLFILPKAQEREV